MPVANMPELVIQPKRGWISIDWAEMYRFRELLFFLIWRDIKVRYKQSVLGVAWAVLVPLLTMFINVVIFHVIIGLGNDTRTTTGQLVPYAIFVYVALLPWQLFSNSLTGGGMSLLNQQHLLTKIYFPRLFVPTSAVGALVVDMGISFLVLLALIVFYFVNPAYHFVPSVGFLFLPLLVLLTLITGLGVAYTLSALTVTYRDFRFLVPFMSQLLQYASFVGYPLKPEAAAHHPTLVWIATLNPMFGIIDSYRAAVLGTPFHPGYLAVSIVISLLLLIYGMFYFRKTERRFADIA